MSKPITIKEIAQKAKVSIGTVDRALHNRGRVSEATREKVLRIAKEGNYSSNILARHLRLNTSYTIQVILPRKNDYWMMIKKGIEQGVAEYASLGFNAQFNFPSEGNDQFTFKELETIINMNCNGYIIAPAVFDGFNQLLIKLENKHTPFVLVDSHTNEKGHLSFIGQDTFDSGMLSARLIHDEYITAYTICVITFKLSELKSSHFIGRYEGFKSFFSQLKNPNINIHEINLEKENIKPNDLTLFLNKLNMPLHIWVPNSKTYQLNKCIKQLKQEGSVRVVGYDLIPDNVKLLENGMVDFLIHQKPQQQGYLGVQTLYKHLVLNVHTSEKQLMPIDIITKENIRYCD